MDILSLLRMFGALGVVLGLLAGTLWAVRRYEIRMPQKWLSGFAASGTERRMVLVERLALDPRRSVALIRKDGREHMLLIAPEGLLILDAANAPKGSKTHA
ncbi:MAG TPA: flagellar biosynthetic protein FliO [Sphingomonas sp.]|jgi:flagellar protein FliO/FliZ|nr:flagellar biosynthetic protein FliO [Sphingomonas sp.]